MYWYIEAMNKYATLSGRARRKEFWMYSLMNFLIGFGIGFFCGLFHIKPVASAFYSLATFIPSIAVTVRRLHDTGNSGWWFLVPIYNLVLLCKPGTIDDNKYGPDPKQSDENLNRNFKKAA